MTEKSEIANRLAECFHVLKTDYVQSAPALAETLGLLYLNDKKQALSLWESLVREHYDEIVEQEILDTGELSTDILHQIKICADIRTAAEALEKSDFLRTAIMGKMTDVSIFILVEILSCYIIDGKTALVSECLNLMLESKPIRDDDDGITWFEILLDRVKDSGYYELGDDLVIRETLPWHGQRPGGKSYTEMMNILTGVMEKIPGPVARARAEVKILYMKYHSGV